jgi:hypothetical protein
MTQENIEAYSVRAFCRAFGIGRTLFYSEVKSGRIEVRKLGKRTLILKEAADRWAAALPTSKA